MTTPTRTFGPLHFEDLEPKRFEDLVRQLAHDFKLWRRLEATGRAGSDDGFDARGYEIAGPAEETVTSDEADEPTTFETDRLWLIQCKREKNIGPTKLVRYLDDVRLRDGEQLHGLVFVAACDFSMEARRQFSDKCAKLGVREWQLWGKGELEDQLLRPENDHLLFAYFGISLVIRRRSQQALLRTRLAMKRKALRVLTTHRNHFVLVRAPEATNYPDAWETPDFDAQRPWLVRRYRGTRHDGILVLLRSYMAYLADDGQSWDAALAFNDAVASEHDDPWGGRDHRNDPLHSTAYRAWLGLPRENRAHLDVVGLIPFENIVDIDEHGDEYVEAPHIYVSFPIPGGPFVDMAGEVRTLESFDQRVLHPTDAADRRTVFFAEDVRHQRAGQYEG